MPAGVERGETIVITRHGRPIARLVPEANVRRDEIENAIAAIKALKSRAARVPIDELIASIHVGHKY